MRNIRRVERNSHPGGYLVRITRRGKLMSEYFLDQEHGGKKESLEAAKKFRDKVETSKPHYTAKQLASRGRSNNTSGTVGVRLVTEADPRWPSKPEYEYWVAQWSPAPGQRRTKRFSVEKYGKDKAFKLAVKARNQGLAEADS